MDVMVKGSGFLNNSQRKRGGFMIHSNDDVPYHERKIKRLALEWTDRRACMDGNNMHLF